jgi:hypothetical protein
MKKFKLLALGIIFFIAGSTRAQVSVNVNIGSPPSWGPSGYAETVLLFTRCSSLLRY